MSDREMSRRALYNLLRMNWLEDSTINVEPWQVDDYRKYELNDLFDRLREEDVELDVSSFEVYSESFDDPDDLADSFVEEGFTVEKQDRIYLLIFELWRRLARSRPTLSVFADELDHQIYLYDKNTENSDDLRNVLEYLLEVIEESSSQDEMLLSITAYCANDIESFLYDFLADQLDQENYLYVSAFLDRVHDVVPYKLPFDFLKVRLLSVSDIEGANESLADVLETLNEEPDYDISLEILQYLADQAAKQAFINLSLFLCREVEENADLLALVRVGRDFFDSFGEETKKAEANNIVQELKNNSDNLYKKSLSTYRKLLESIVI